MSFAIAAALRFGDIRLEHLTDAVVADPATVTLMDKVIMHTGPRWSDPAAQATAPEGAHVRIDLNNGQKLERYRARPRGSVDDPLSDTEIDTKFRRCAALLFDAASADTLLHNLHSVESLASVRNILDILR
jgi:2-methylcitrate dehydratase PrpD